MLLSRLARLQENLPTALVQLAPASVDCQLASVPSDGNCMLKRTLLAGEGPRLPAWTRMVMALSCTCRPHSISRSACGLTATWVVAVLLSACWSNRALHTEAVSSV
jgi:hypothetical protein